MSAPPDPLAPVAAHDSLPFAQLSRSYNFENVSGRGLLLARLVAEACEQRAGQRPIRVVDIGCGNGIERQERYQWAIRERLDEYWGVEPDPGITPPPGLFTTYRNATLETAALPANHFDVAYSFMVMEHVADPEAFMRALGRCLRPGGVYIFVTPNGRHYFARTASVLRRLRLDELVLRLTVGRAADEYHYPVQYRFNGERRIREIARETGFDPPEFAYFEVHGPIGYFPKPLRFVYHALQAKRRFIRRPESLLTMVCQVRKAAHP